MALNSKANGTNITLFQNEPLATAHTTGNSRLDATPVTLLGVQRQVVAKNTRRFFGRHFCQYRHIIQDGGNIIQ